jgi:hypothetical protein
LTGEELVVEAVLGLNTRWYGIDRDSEYNLAVLEWITDVKACRCGIDVQHRRWRSIVSGQEIDGAPTTGT